MNRRKRLARMIAREVEEETREATGRDCVVSSDGQSLAMAIARARDIARQRKKETHAGDENTLPDDQDGPAMA